MLRADVRAAGFTLLEAMVALVIVTLGMMAVTTQLDRYVMAAQFIEEKTLASWIASNKITELSVGTTWPAVDEYEEEVEFAGRTWRCTIEVSETDVQNLHRVDVSVRLAQDPDRVVPNPERVIHKVSGLIEPPAPPGFPPLQWAPPSAGERG